MLTPHQTTNICKAYSGSITCRYLLLKTQGFVCGKLTDLKPRIDKQCEKGLIKAIGDNCAGVPND